jgi:tripartite-type tricarboxylate transporter receptor subunit TctC
MVSKERGARRNHDRSDIERRRGGARAVCLLVALATTIIAAPAHAQTFPDRPIRLIVPAGPGGSTDLPARLVSQILPKLGQPAVVENRAGSGGAIGARAVNRTYFPFFFSS